MSFFVFLSDQYCSWSARYRQAFGLTTYLPLTPYLLQKSSLTPDKYLLNASKKRYV